MSRIWKFSNNVDTDQIVPGRYAPYMRPNEDVGTAAFIEAAPDFNKNAQPGDIIVAGENFGCGSSREYAPLALKRRGIAAIVAVSFARIFFRNAINLGIPIFIDPDAAERLLDGVEVDFDFDKCEIKTTTDTIALPELPNFARKIVQAGGIGPYVRQHNQFPVTIHEA